jgi:hypothetical protein
MWIIVGFSSNIAKCQPVRQEFYNLMGVYLPCTGAYIKGVVLWERTEWDNKIQIKVRDGILIGTISHL